MDKVIKYKVGRYYIEVNSYGISIIVPNKNKKKVSIVYDMNWEEVIRETTKEIA